PPPLRACAAHRRTPAVRSHQAATTYDQAPKLSSPWLSPRNATTFAPTMSTSSTLDIFYDPTPFIAFRKGMRSQSVKASASRKIHTKTSTRIIDPALALGPAPPPRGGR